MKPLSFRAYENPGAATLERPQAKPDSNRLDAPATGEADGFTKALATAVEKVDEVQLSADAEAAKLAQGEGNLHETMLALEKADVTMRVATKARNKVIDAYNEVMRMPV